MANGRRARGVELVIGEHLLRPRYLFWLTVFNIVLHITGSFDIKADRISERLIGVLAGVAVQFIIGAGGYFLWQRLGRRNYVMWLAFFLGGLARGLIVDAIFRTLDAVEVSSTSFRPLSSALTLPVVAAVTGYLLGLRSYWIDAFSGFAKIKAELESKKANSDAELESLTREDFSEVKNLLVNSLSKSENDQPGLARDRIRNLLESTLRPYIANYLTRNYSIRSDAHLESDYEFRWSSVLTLLRSENSIRPLQSAMLMIVLAAPSQLHYLSLEMSLRVMALVLILNALGQYLVRWISIFTIDKWSVWPRILGLILLSAASQLPVALAFWMTTKDIPQVQITPFQAILAVPLFVVVRGLTHSVQSELSTINTRTVELERELRWHTAELNGRLWHHRQTFARLLHGPIQAELAAAAIRLDQQTAANQVMSENETLDYLNQRLKVLLDSTAVAKPFSDVMAEVVETWEGICEVTFTVSEKAKQDMIMDALCEEVVLEIIREVCSNAIRHGQATKVEVELASAVGNLLSLRIVNDGKSLQRAPSENGRTGMGTIYISECSYEHSLMQWGTQVVFEALVPVRQTEALAE